MKLKSIISALVVILTLTTCTNLEEEYFSVVPVSEYGTTPDEIKTIAGTAYASLRGGIDGATYYYPPSEYVFFLTECVSDEVCVPTRGADWYDGGRYQQAQVHDMLPDNPMVLSGWKYCYKGISSCNFVISFIEAGNLSDEEKLTATAEIRGIRAYYYFLLLDWFGNVPLSVSFPEPEPPGTSTRAQVYEFVENELLEIRDYLQPGIEYGRFTQNVCNTLLARLYINSKVFIGIPRWQDCIDACDQVSGYELTANNLQNFITENQYSPEIIWAVPYDHTEGTKGNYLASLTMHYNQWQAYGKTVSDWTWSVNGICAQPGVYSSFEEGDKRINCMEEGIQWDIRYSEPTPIYDRTGAVLDYTENIIDFYNALEYEGVRLKKYEIKAGEVSERDHDLVLMRWAEILMMKAECYVRLGNPGDAYPLVEQIRIRSGLTTTPNPITLEVLDTEWLHEFLFEGLRRTVNIRFGTYFEPWWSKPNPTPVEKAIFPIPETELEINNKLVQNPGY